ncbi:MAG: type II secretion system protein [Pyrinomonadaceae bacterium]|nr:type II secretion system protein [Phycisphaerales bacterium]
MNVATTRHSRHAFTLIEAIIAIVILSIAMPSMLIAVRTAYDKRVGPVQTSRARWLAVEKLEDIIADRSSATRGFAYLTAANYAPESSIAGFPGFSRSVTLRQTTANLLTAGNGYMLVTVTVSWTDTGGASRSMSLSTVLTATP